jgi:protein TonB
MGQGIPFAGTVDLSRPEIARRGLTTLTSFALQVLVAGLLLLLPLLRPIGLPSLRQISTPISLGEPLRETPAVRSRSGQALAPSHPAVIVFRQPSQIPPTVLRTSDEGAPEITASGLNVPGVVGSGDGRSLPNMFAEGTRPVLPPAPPRPTHVRLSQMNPGDLIRKVQPLYPALARSARIQGVVVLQATIGRDGTIENLRVSSGHPMLTSSAIDAVRQWRYRPYILNGEPVEVETQIIVNFSLAGN